MSEPILEAHGLVKAIGGRDILKGLDFDLASRAGRRPARQEWRRQVDADRTLLGFALPTAGSSRVFGEESGAMSAATQGRIGFVPQTG